MIRNWFVPAFIHGPSSPSGQRTLTSDSIVPKPKWLHPRTPPAWPPPTVTSRRCRCRPTRTSIQAPMASELGGSWRSRTANQPPVGEATGANVAPEGHVLPTHHHHQVEQAVEVQIDHTRPAAATEADQSRPRRPIPGIARQGFATADCSDLERHSRALPRRCLWSRRGRRGHRC